LRESVGYEGIGAEGDILYQNFSLIPLGSDDKAEKRFSNILSRKGYKKAEISDLVAKYYANK